MPTNTSVNDPCSPRPPSSLIADASNLLPIGREIDLTAKEAIPFLKNFRNGIMPVLEDFLKAGDHLAKAIFESIDHPDLPPIQELDVPEMNAR